MAKRSKAPKRARDDACEQLIPAVVPTVSLGVGLGRLTFIGESAIREGGWSIRFVMVTRGIANLILALASLTALIKLVLWSMSLH